MPKIQSRVTLNPSLFILKEVKDLDSTLRLNTVKDMTRFFAAAQNDEYYAW